jgi:peptide chain release factor 1
MSTQPLENQIKQIDAKIAEAKQLKQDPEFAQIAQEEIEQLESQKAGLQQAIATINGDFDQSDNSSDSTIDQSNALLEVRAGTGGDEAKIFAEDLLRMYLRFIETKKLKSEVMDEGVIKIKGRGAYGLFKYESGVHRVQRVPETESQGRIHTSTASVAVLPEVKPTQVEIRDEDLEWKFTRAGGKGGQNVNKVNTAVLLTHTPSGIVVNCRQERSQQQNRILALELLRSQLWEMEEEKRLSKIVDKRRSAVGRATRAEKIRTYNYPQNRVTDHRINQSWYSLETIIQGDLTKVLSTVKEKLESDSTEE